MAKGFFTRSTAVQDVPTKVPRCGACGLSRGIKSPRMPVSGRGRRKILVVAEAPGENEDERGTQLIGKSGKLLRTALGKHGIDLDKDCWKTNAVTCWPNGRELTKKHVQACRPNLLRAVEELKPTTVILLGDKAVRSLIGWLWGRGEDIGTIGRWVGWRIPCQRLNAWLCPTWHPAHLLRQNDSVLELWWGRHLEAAVGLDGEPWPDDLPDYAGCMERVYEPNKAAAIIEGVIKEGGAFSFDYETDRLKPDHPDARIVSCAVCQNGKRTITFPWAGPAIEAMGKLLRSRVPKIGWNILFEQRWTQRVFGYGVRNWAWDGMQAAHALDNRSGITGAKFQAFVRLGLDPYGGPAAAYISGEGGNGPNRMDKMPVDELLTYNGMDALVEYKIAELQMKELGVTLNRNDP